MFKIKLKSNLVVAAINKNVNCKYYTIDNVINDLKVKWITINHLRIKRMCCIVTVLRKL